MIDRHLSDSLKDPINHIPVLTLTGPRQSGKTTFVRKYFSKFAYLNLEESDTREFALTDPKGFLNTFKGDLILDEIQHVPQLFSYIQVIVDKERNNRRFILTGSQNFLLLEKISQTLAGRTAFYNLLPFSMEELKTTPHESDSYSEYLFKGFYPRIYDKNLDPSKWLDDYIMSYVERDVRSIINIGDLIQFQRFVRLCAGRIGQLVNFSDMGNELGINYHTVQRWLSVLETSFIIFRLQPWHTSYNKRIVKSPKLYFYDTGLASFLLGIRNNKELDIHFARGALFENLILAELMKFCYNQGKKPLLYFWRDRTGNEVDCIIESGRYLIPIEIKSGTTISDEWFKTIRYFQNLTEKAIPESSFVIYGGTGNQSRSDCNIVSWKDSISALKECIV
jgi:predicted AAA+ superfamily ATPase